MIVWVGSFMEAKRHAKMHYVHPLNFTYVTENTRDKLMGVEFPNKSGRVFYIDYAVPEELVLSRVR